MKKLFSIGYTTSAFNIAIFILRAGSAILMIPHGYDKLVKYNEYAPNFMSFLGMSGGVALSLVIFAEFFCAMFVAIGLFTRLACIPIIIDMFIAVSRAHNYQIFGDGERGSLFFLIFLTVLIIGPGKISIDGMIKK